MHVPMSDLFDGIAGLIAAVVMVSALIVWFVAIVPLQYFIVVVAGAPARLAIKLRTLATSDLDGSASERPDSSELEKWESNLLSAPVSMTNAVAALIILAIRLARSGAA